MAIRQTLGILLAAMLASCSQSPSGADGTGASATDSPVADVELAPTAASMAGTNQTAQATQSVQLISAAATGSARAAHGPVLVELFTSQGCSSCPPADRLMADIVSDPGLVVVTRPVTYWDRLGWRDTLARPENTQLQRAYADGPVGRGRAYTPQAVVDGAAGLVGSRRTELQSRIAEARRRSSGATMAVRSTRDGGRSVVLSGRTDRDATLTLVALDSRESVAIGRGENGGRTVVYINVLRDEHQLASWTGGSQSVTIPTASLRTANADRYALILRQGEAGRILAAQYI